MSAAGFIERVREAWAANEAALPATLPPQERRAALERLAAFGVPGPRDDAWRYADVRALQNSVVGPAANDVPPSPAAAALAAGIAPATLEGVPSTRLVFVDGRLDRALSQAPAAALGPWAAAPAGERAAAERFALLNDIFALDAARFRVGGDCVLDLVFVASGQVAAYPRVQLELAPGVRLTLVERHLGGGNALTSAVVELQLGRDAHCRHYRLQDLDVTATHVESLSCRLAAGAALETVTLHLGGGAVRSTLDCELAGRGAGARLHAASIADGARTLDSALTVRHAAADTTSLQELRAIARDRAGVAFQSCVAVNAGATGSDSRQSLKGLIGGGTAEINLRPQLEIDTDSVRASHGATTGAIDEAMLFYLLSRGLDRETAQQLLEWAFIETVIGRIELPALRRELEERAVARLGNRAAQEVLA